MNIYAIGKYCLNAVKDEENLKGFSNNPNDPFFLKAQKNAEEYEKFFELDYIEDVDTLVLSDASEDMNGILLRLFENIRQAKIVILLLRDEKTLNTKQKINQKIFCNVLQEYARSGLLDRVYLLHLSKIINKLNSNISNFENDIYDFIKNIYNLVYFLHNQEPFYGKKFETSEINRISTIGSVSDNEVSFLFDIESESPETHYVAFIDKNSKNSNSIMNYCDRLSSKDKCSYEIHISEEETMIFSIKSTNVIQALNGN